MDGKALANIGEIAQDLIPTILYFYPKAQYDLFYLALFAALSQAAERLHIAGDMRSTVAQRAVSASTLRQLDSVLTLFAVGGDYHAVVSKVDSPLVFDSTIHTACTVSISEAAAGIKMKYRDLFPTL